jgi:adenosyl cobinamide kinase/adenosyl cobinamide phosphate guanylyltransferase
MIVYFCGQKNSGKSLCAEEYLKRRVSNVLYIGTLPLFHYYLETIENHRARRPADWDLYECCGDIEYDVNTICSALTERCGLLIDGLSYYVIRNLEYDAIDTKAVRQIAHLLKYIEAKNVLCVFVDTPLHPEYSAVEVRAVGLIHKKIIRMSKELYFCENNKVAEILNKETMISLDFRIPKDGE